MPATRLSERVCARLAQAEACELNPHVRDDLKIARLAVRYAATGEAALCAPHVLASYMVLGLHPDKVWPAIVARRKALFGLKEEKFWGVQQLPPKKPPVSAVVRSQQKLWSEKTNAVRAATLDGGVAGGLRDHTNSVPMAAPSIAASYPKPDGAGSPFFKQEELQEFFDTCPPDLVETRQLRTIESMWNAVGAILGKKPFGARIQFFLSVDHYRTNRYRSASAVRYNLRRAERDGNLQVDYRDDLGRCHHIWVRPRTKTDRGDYRRVPTYSLSIPLLLKWREWKRNGKLHADVEPIRKPVQPTPTDPEPAKAAPIQRPAAEETRKPLQITRDVKRAIAGCYANARKQGQDEASAIRETCEALSNESRCLTESEVRLQLKIWQSANGSLEPPRVAAPESRNCQCGESLVQNRGPGPRLICPKCTT